MMKKVRPITALVFSLAASPSFAVVCTDPAGNALHLQEMAKDAAIWLEEKGMYIAGMTQDKAISLYEMMRGEYNASAEISAQTTAVSTTQNAAAEERYSTSPSACATFARAKGILASMTDTCESPVTKALFANNQSQIADCGHGGSGLNCNRVAKQRMKVSKELSDAVRDKNGKDLLTLMDGSKLLGLSDAPMQPDDKEKHDLALSMLLGLEDPVDMPRLADGSMFDSSDVNGSRLMTQWARKNLLRSIPNSALGRVKNLYDPQPDGSGSLMAMLEEQVNYYNSPEFLKLLTNTNDKSGLPSNWDTLTPAQKHEWNKNASVEKKLVSSEQVTRMLGEMMAFSLRLEYMTLKSTISTNSLTALQLKMMSE